MYITFANEEFQYRYGQWDIFEGTIEAGNQDTYIPWDHELVSYNRSLYYDGDNNDWAGLLYLHPLHDLPEDIFVNGYIKVYNSYLGTDLPFQWSSSEGFMILGDINGDGGRNILDIVKMLNHILGNIELSDEAFERADLNADGIVNINDIIMLINIILEN